MPWYNGKFFFDKDKINMSEQRFNALPPQNTTSNNLLVYNSNNGEVNSRSVLSLPPGGAAPGAATSNTFYVTFQTGQDKKVNSDPLYDDGIVRFGWDAPGNDIEFYLIPGSEPSGINPATGAPWGPIPSLGTGTPTGRLSANVWNMDGGLPSISTFIFPGTTYDLVPAGIFSLERAWGTISPYYDGANPHKAPNFFSGYNPTNSYIGVGPPFPIYNFIYHNLGGSDNVTLQIERIDNPP
tara:strand:+ start:293 stop:1009 length:717 start_codon:yes stop_codon:yes gene_type:complete